MEAETIAALDKINEIVTRKGRQSIIHHSLKSSNENKLLKYRRCGCLCLKFRFSQQISNKSRSRPLLLNHWPTSNLHFIGLLMHIFFQYFHKVQKSEVLTRVGQMEATNFCFEKHLCCSHTCAHRVLKKHRFSKQKKQTNLLHYRLTAEKSEPRKRAK